MTDEPEKPLRCSECKREPREEENEEGGWRACLLHRSPVSAIRASRARASRRIHLISTVRIFVPWAWHSP